jgi:hypothetical protein
MHAFHNPEAYPDFLCVPCDLAVFNVFDLSGAYVEWYWGRTHYSDDDFKRALKLKAFW